MKVAEELNSNEETEAIIGLYLLFARLLSEELNSDLVQILRQPGVLEIFSQAEPEVAAYLDHDWQESDYEHAAVVFCDTFILPGKSLQPRAAAWLDEGNQVSSDGIHAVVESFLRKMEITLPSEYSHLPFDHASILFFVAATLRQIGSEQCGEFEAATLGSWINSFGLALGGGASPLYRAIGKVIAVL